jgi:hypothetical protein
MRKSWISKEKFQRLEMALPIPNTSQSRARREKRVASFLRREERICVQHLASFLRREVSGCSWGKVKYRDAVYAAVKIDGRSGGDVKISGAQSDFKEIKTQFELNFRSRSYNGRRAQCMSLLIKNQACVSFTLK